MSDYGTADIPRTKESEFFGAPWEKESRDLMIELSPLTHAGGVTTPTLFLHGELDHRVPIAEAEQMYVALRKKKTPQCSSGIPSHTTAVGRLGGRFTRGITNSNGGASI